MKHSTRKVPLGDPQAPVKRSAVRFTCPPSTYNTLALSQLRPLQSPILPPLLLQYSTWSLRQRSGRSDGVGGRRRRVSLFCGQPIAGKPTSTGLGGFSLRLLWRTTPRRGLQHFSADTADYGKPRLHLFECGGLANRLVGGAAHVNIVSLRRRRFSCWRMERVAISESAQESRNVWKDQVQGPELR